MKKPTKQPPSITTSAKLAIAHAAFTAKRLRADLMALNIALSIAGNDTVAERLAHDALLKILLAFAPVQSGITDLANACK